MANKNIYVMKQEEALKHRLKRSFKLSIINEHGVLCSDVKGMFAFAWLLSRIGFNVQVGAAVESH